MGGHEGRRCGRGNGGLVEQGLGVTTAGLSGVLGEQEPAVPLVGGSAAAAAVISMVDVV